MRQLFAHQVALLCVLFGHVGVRAAGL
jgi:hypothetical protein